MKAEELVQRCEELVNELKAAVEQEGLGLIEVEKRVLCFINSIGSLMLQEVVEGAREPLVNNRAYVGDDEVRYLDERPMSFLNRFGYRNKFQYLFILFRVWLSWFWVIVSVNGP